VATLAAIQVGIPLLALFDDRPARFGWHMYSTLNPAPEASIEDESGAVTPVNLGSLIADPRAEIRWSEPLAELLCRDESAVAIVVSDREGTSRVPCT
jgi:hypothetical protein